MQDPASIPAASLAPSVDPIDAILADLKAKHPLYELEIYTSGILGRMILKSPDEGDCSLWYAERDNAAKTVQNANALCRRCILYPAIPVVDEVFRKKPLVGQPISLRLIKMAGIDDEIKLGK